MRLIFGLEMSQYLFAYGTLRLNQDHKLSKEFESKSELIGLGYMSHARLYKIDWQPALIKSDNKADIVIGDIYKIKDAQIITSLDEYEGVGVGQPPYEYDRHEVEVISDGKTYPCWVYWYNFKLPENADWIESGDFLNP